MNNKEVEQAAEQAVNIAVTEYAKAFSEALAIKHGQRQVKSMVNKIGFKAFQKIIINSWVMHKSNIEKGLCYAIKMLEVEMAFDIK